MTAPRTVTRLTHQGARYVLATDPGQVTFRTAGATNLSPKLYTDFQMTNATGALTFNLPTGYFTTIQAVQAQAMRDTVNPDIAPFALVRTVTLDTVVVQVFEGKSSGVLLGGVISGLKVASGVCQVSLFLIGT